MSMTTDPDTDHDTERSAYQAVCPVCNADSGDFTFESPQKARESLPKSVECARCGNDVTPAVVDRSVRTELDRESEE